jgi:hypothetical protein
VGRLAAGAHALEPGKPKCAALEPRRLESGRTGGQAQQFTDVKGRLSSYDWSPAGKRPLLAMAERDPRDGLSTVRHNCSRALAGPFCNKMVP